MLVTGGCGFIGSNFIHLVARTRPDWRVVNLDLLTYAGNLNNLEAIVEGNSYRFVKGDICDQPLVSSLFEQERIDTVVHFAAESHVDRSIVGPDAFIRTNIIGTFTLLEAARTAWAKRGGEQDGPIFLHVSTDEVFGSLGESGYFSETTAYDPRSPYSASKASSDHLVSAYCHTYGLPVMITNCSNNYGPYQFPEKLIPLIFNNSRTGKELPVYGDGKNIRDWLYVTDHCQAIIEVLEKGRSGRTYNIGGNNEKTNIEVVTLICDLLDAKIGLLPGWGLSQRLPRVVGPSTAKENSLTARRVPATEAASLGFVTRVVPDDALASAAREVAEGIAQWDPAHIARIKELMDDGYALPLSDALVLEVERAADLNRQVKIGGRLRRPPQRYAG